MGRTDQTGPANRGSVPGFEAKLWLAADTCIVRLLVEMLAPYKGRVYDPCCGSGGMFVQSEKFVEAHGGRLGDISIYGQESNATTRRLALMNLAIRGLEADFGPEHADTFHRELTDADIQKIVTTYHAWRGDGGTSVPARRGREGKGSAAASPHQPYADIPGFCKSATTAEIAAHGYVLTPGRYVGAEEVEEDGEPFEEKLPRLVAELRAQFAESARLEEAIKANLKGLGDA